MQSLVEELGKLLYSIDIFFANQKDQVVEGIEKANPSR